VAVTNAAAIAGDFGARFRRSAHVSRRTNAAGHTVRFDRPSAGARNAVAAERCPPRIVF
jgi:hypothetical protein